EFLAADLADTRLLVVATYRDTEVEREHPFSATLARLASEPTTRRLLVGGLSPADCARWLAVLRPPGAAAALGGALHRETHGNPSIVTRPAAPSPGARAPAFWETRKIWWGAGTPPACRMGCAR